MLLRPRFDILRPLGPVLLGGLYLGQVRLCYPARLGEDGRECPLAGTQAGSPRKGEGPESSRRHGEDSLRAETRLICKVVRGA